MTITLWGTGSPYREFLHVDDLAEACVFIVNNIDSDNLKAQASESSLKPARKADIKNTHINIGTGHDVTIKDLASLTPQQAALIVNLFRIT